MSGRTPHPMTEAPSTGPAPGRAAAGGETAAVLAVARAEAWLLLRHPAVLAATGLIAAPWIWQAVTGDPGTHFAVLHNESRFVQLPLLLFAAAVFIAANFAALRSHRYGTVNLYAALPLSAAGRFTAHVLSLLPAALLGLALVSARLAYLAAQPGAVGRIAPLELLTVPAVVLLTGALGILVARLKPALPAGPVVLVLLGIITVYKVLDLTAANRWLSLIAYEDEFAPPLPAELVGRPAGWHVLWLLALTGVVTAVLLWLNGAPRGRVAAGVAVCLAVAVTAGVMQLRPLSAQIERGRERVEMSPSREEVCRTRRAVTYCAFPDFTGQIDAWAGVVESIRGRVPADAYEAAAPYSVRQRYFPDAQTAGESLPAPLARWQADDRRAGTPDAVTVGTYWTAGTGRGTDLSNREVLDFALHFAQRTVTGGKQPLAADRPTEVCGGRAAAVLWLAARAVPSSYEAVSDNSYGSGVLGSDVLSSSAGLSFDPRTPGLVDSLLAQPGDEVDQRVRASWKQLTAPDTTIDRAAALLGVKAPAPDRSGMVMCT